MLPETYHLPALVLLVVGGFLACFFGYKLFRFVLGLYGFIVGAFVGVWLTTGDSTGVQVAAAIGGGLLGALLLWAVYFLAVAVIGAGLGALLAQTIFVSLARDPYIVVTVLFAVIGAVGAIIFQRYLIIVVTALGGAWTLVAGVMALVGDERARTAIVTGEAWLAYPMHVALEQRGVMVAWGLLSLAGVLVQLQQSSRRRRGRR
jgi:hypothetical protein